MTQTELIEAARSWIGVPFLHQGRTPHGVDCVGFIEGMMRACGALPPGYEAPTIYSRRPDGRLLLTINKYCTHADGYEGATLILIQWRKDSEPSHAAISTGPTIIHAYQRARAVIENGYRGIWKRDTHSVWRLPNVVYP